MKEDHQLLTGVAKIVAASACVILVANMSHPKIEPETKPETKPATKPETKPEIARINHECRWNLSSSNRQTYRLECFDLGWEFHSLRLKSVDGDREDITRVSPTLLGARLWEIEVHPPEPGKKNIQLILELRQTSNETLVPKVFLQHLTHGVKKDQF